ncbi:MAG TPA: DNA polymerase I [Rubricoccaceae bacterium]|jgi:DNA polymerase-1
MPTDPTEPSLFDTPLPPDVPAPDAPETAEAPAAPPWDGPDQPTDDDFDGPPRETLFLADALALAYRAYFSMRNSPLTTPDGLTDTRALYGFATAILKLLEDHAPEHIAVVFDALTGGPNFRQEAFADYKGHRPPMPDGIKGALPYIKRFVEALDIPVLEVEGVEADDVIGTLARRAQTEDVDVVIFSPDKDFRQLLADRTVPAAGESGRGAVHMLRPPYQGEAFDRETPATFRERYGGLDPEQFVDLLALMGDTADNVPGVPGIGEKTAVGLIASYGTVENLLEHAAEVKGKKAQEGLTNHADDARLSKHLVCIETNVPLSAPGGGPLDWHTLRRTEPDLAAVNALFDEVGFGGRLRARVKDYAEGRARTTRQTILPDDDPSLSFDFGPYIPVTAMGEAGVDYTTVHDHDSLPLAAAVGNDVLSFDTETTSVESMEAELVGIALSDHEESAVYVPTPLPDGTPTETAVDAIRARLEDPDLLKVGHNVKYDLVVMARHGVRVQGPIFDTMIAHYLINPEASHKMDDVSSFYLNYRPQPITDLIGTGKNALSMRDVPVEDVGPYACEDADVALRLMPVLREKLREMDAEPDGEGSFTGGGRVLEIAETMEFPLVPVLADMEMAGVKIDERVLADIRVGLDATLADLETKITEAAGRRFTIGSTQQLAEVLFNPVPTDAAREAARVWQEEVDSPLSSKTKKQLKDEAPTFGLGLKALSKTSTGRPSTDENALTELAKEHALPALVLDWRKVAKLKSTYVDKLPELIHPETGRVHTNFNQTIAATGRLSSSSPNLQNIPIRTEVGREIRRAFVAEPGCAILSADYAQIELRILAHLSMDAGLVEAFESGQDIHTATGARVFGVPYDAVTRAQRDRVKQVNYGIPYGISAFGLANRLRITNAEAQELINEYRAAYPGVIQTLDGILQDARRTGYVETLLGRRRYVPQITSRNPNDRAYAERIAINMPIQGTQADMIKLAMIAIHGRLADEGLKARMILQVHDELVFEVPEAEVDAVSALVTDEMQRALPLDVPIVVGLGTAPNWLDAH